MTCAFRRATGSSLFGVTRPGGTASASMKGFESRSASRADMHGRYAVRTTTEPAVDVRRMKRIPTHPGEMLFEEFLKPLGMSQADAARKMRISSNRLNELIRKKRGVTAETALRLADLL